MTGRQAPMRVRVTWQRDQYRYWAKCDGCHIGTWWSTLYCATDYAHRHAATCPALKLAALVRELEGLRDKWIRDANKVSLLDRLYFRIHADAITAILGRLQ